MAVTRGKLEVNSRQLSLDLDSVTPPRSDLPELWTPDDILVVALKEGADSLRRFREDNRVEWKSARYSPKDLADYFRSYVEFC